MIESLIKAQAYGTRLSTSSASPDSTGRRRRAFDEWLEHGHAGEMDYMPRTAEKRRDSRLPFPSAKSAIVVGLDYGGREPSGPIARYARGDDYHDVLLERLRLLHARVDEIVGVSVAGKAYVDTGPILERDLARRAGLGWFGKNTMLINPKRGSFFFLGELLLDFELEPDAPFASDHCGTCRRCIDACPTARSSTSAIDSNRCISYLTIELRERSPPEWHASIGEMMYGATCARRCPWNESFAAAARGRVSARAAPSRQATR
jgi:epoxyqueuosine reductase